MLCEYDGGVISHREGVGPGRGGESSAGSGRRGLKRLIKRTKKTGASSSSNVMFFTLSTLLVPRNVRPCFLLQASSCLLRRVHHSVESTRIHARRSLLHYQPHGTAFWTHLRAIMLYGRSAGVQKRSFGAARARRSCAAGLSGTALNNDDESVQARESVAGNNRSW